jgi:hypothetical protein
MTEQLEYDNIFDSIYPDEPEKAAELKLIGELCMKHDIVPFSGTNRYKDMRDAASKFYALEAAGVDNWEGYEEALADQDD